MGVLRSVTGGRHQIGGGSTWQSTWIPGGQLFINGESDAAVLGWDMLDASANDPANPVHGVLYAYGVAILDNALLEPLAAACAEEGRYEFLLTVNPLVIKGGTGSAVNPIAVF